MSKVKVRKVKPEDFSPQAYFVHYENEIKSVITPKNCASLAMVDCGIEIDEIDFERFWYQFGIYLAREGYVLSDHIKE